MTPQEIDAFKKELVDAMPRVHSFAMVLVAGNKSRAEDLVQSSVLKALESMDSFTPGSSMVAWLNTIVRNKLIDQTRSGADGKTDPVGFDEGGTLDQPISGGQEFSETLNEVTQWANANLSDNEKTVLFLAAEGYSYEEISESYGLSKANVGVLLLRARRKLAERFA